MHKDKHQQDPFGAGMYNHFIGSNPSFLTFPTFFCIRNGFLSKILRNPHTKFQKFITQAQTIGGNRGFSFAGEVAQMNAWGKRVAEEIITKYNERLLQTPITLDQITEEDISEAFQAIWEAGHGPRIVTVVPHDEARRRATEKSLSAQGGDLGPRSLSEGFVEGFMAYTDFLRQSDGSRVSNHSLPKYEDLPMAPLSAASRSNASTSQSQPATQPTPPQRLSDPGFD